jgi:hypothetical protein
MNLALKNNFDFVSKISIGYCIVLLTTTSCLANNEDFQYVEYKNIHYPYIEYQNLAKDENVEAFYNQEFYAGDTHFLYPAYGDLFNIRMTQPQRGAKDFGFPVTEGAYAGGGTLTIKSGVISLSSIPISIPLNFRKTKSWIGSYNEKCSSGAQKYQGDIVNINIQCTVKGKISKGIWNSKEGLIYYEQPCEKNNCPMQLKSKNGLFSPKFFEFYRTKSREIAAKSKSGKPADVIPDIIY